MVEGLDLFMVAPWLLLCLSLCGNMIPYDWIIVRIDR
jgi:hypothetical protein